MPFLEDKLAAAGLYVGLNLLVLLWLAIAVVGARVSNKVTLGDGGVPAMQQAVRAHGNAAEYVPAALIAIVVLALLPSSPLWAVHAAGAAVTVARVAHGLGLLSNPGRSPGRAVGTLGTWLTYIALAGALIWFAAVG